MTKKMDVEKADVVETVPVAPGGVTVTLKKEPEKKDQPPREMRHGLMKPPRRKQ